MTCIMLFFGIVLPVIVAATDVRVEVQPGIVLPEQREGVTIKCFVMPSRDELILRIALLKISNLDSEVLAEITNVQNEPVVRKPGITADGDIYASHEQRSTLNMGFERTTRDIYGKYECHVLLENRRDGLILRKAETEVGRYSDLISLAFDIHTSVDRLRNELERKIGDLRGKIDMVPKGVNEIRTIVWPRGTYGLMMPSFGCPEEDITEWTSGVLKIHTESSSGENQNEVSRGNHLRRPVFDVISGQRIAITQFCMKKKRTARPTMAKR